MSTPFMKGAAAQQAMQHEQNKAAMRSNGTFRFYVKVNNGVSEDRDITFLDGNLDANGLLDVPFINEHRLKINGDFQMIACTEPNEPCPLCEMAQQSNSQDYGFAAFTGFFTVIDHTGYVDKDGVSHTDVIRLFAAKRKTIELLTKMAQNSGTLAGMRFSVSRSSNKAAAVGDIFVPKGQYNVQDLLNHYKQHDPQTKIGVLNYDKEVTYFDAQTLRGMLGTGGGMPMGGAQGGAGQPNALPYSHANGVNSQAPALMTQDHQAVPEKKLQMIATDFTYQQYKDAGWKDDVLVAQGKAQWVQSAPQAPAQPQQAAPQQSQAPDMPTLQPTQQQAAPAPQQQAAPAPQQESKKLQMIATDFTYEQYVEAGWKDDMLVAKGKAQWVTAQAPMPDAAPAPNAPDMPFQPHDPNVPDVDTNYEGQL